MCICTRIGKCLINSLSIVQLNSGDGDGDGDGGGVTMFHVPAKGGVSDRNIWNSKMSRFYYGCSNASSKFASE